MTDPSKEYQKALNDLKKAEQAYASAESNLIQARRALDAARSEFPRRPRRSSAD